MSLVGLPSNWRFQAANDTGVTLKIGLSWRGQNLNSSGALVYSPTWTQLWDWDNGGAAADTIATGDKLPEGNTEPTATTIISNEGDLYLGLEAWWKVRLPTGSPSPDGLFTIRLQTYEDTVGVEEWQEEGEGIVVASIYMKTATGDLIVSGHFTI